MKEKKSFNLITLILIGTILILAIIGIASYCLNLMNAEKKQQDMVIENTLNSEDENEENIQNTIDSKSENEIKNDAESKKNDNLNFDFKFLKLENQKENKVYSPLSIKYALKMLEEGTEGETKKQISNLLGDIEISKYTSSKNLSLANSLFIRDSFKDDIKDDYINTLKNKYNAEVKFDLFENAKNINNWISEKTFKIIPNIIEDENIKSLDFALINALAIDMEWEEKFIPEDGSGGITVTEFSHEKRDIDFDDYGIENNDEYFKKVINVSSISQVSSNTFQSNDTEIEVSGMEIYASINNYDIVNELGEDNIRKIVSDEYTKFAKGESYDTDHAGGDFPLSEDVSDNGIKKDLEEYLPKYISEIDSNYHKAGSSTEFSIYTDDSVKVFAKDLKEYDGTTLQYVGIMPTSIELDEFITNMDKDTIDNYISNLKDISYENFKEGVVTRIYGYIPKFDFEYNLDLMEDLKACNITNVFDENEADLSNITDMEDAYISSALHKANIEFTQDGIKAAAATVMGGFGAGEPFNYYFDVPVEDIDMTFDKPYMFLIQDKETGEIWFTGTVYEPLLWENEPEKDALY